MKVNWKTNIFSIILFFDHTSYMYTRYYCWFVTCRLEAIPIISLLMIREYSKVRGNPNRRQVRFHVICLILFFRLKEQSQKKCPTKTEVNTLRPYPLKIYMTWRSYFQRINFQKTSSLIYIVRSKIWNTEEMFQEMKSNNQWIDNWLPVAWQLLYLG